MSELKYKSVTKDQNFLVNDLYYLLAFLKSFNSAFILYQASMFNHMFGANIHTLTVQSL